MSRFDTKMPAPNAVAVSSTTTFKVPIGRRYHALSLVGSATTFAVDDLSEIRVIANEQVIQRFTGADRNTMNQFLGRDAAGISAARFDLVIPFDRYGLLNREAEEESALNTGSRDEAGRAITSLSVEIDINATPTGTPRLEMYATQSEQLAGGPGLVPYIHKVTKDFASADIYDISDLPRGGRTNQFMDMVFMKPSAGTLENLQVFANDVKLFERTAEQNERRQRDGVRIPQGGWYVIDKTEHGYGGDPFDLRALNDWRIKLTASQAMSLKMYTHYLGGLGE
jgi:hypothetical protein